MLRAVVDVSRSEPRCCALPVAVSVPVAVSRAVPCPARTPKPVTVSVAVDTSAAVLRLCRTPVPTTDDVEGSTIALVPPRFDVSVNDDVVEPIVPAENAAVRRAVLERDDVDVSTPNVPPRQARICGVEPPSCMPIHWPVWAESVAVATCTPLRYSVRSDPTAVRRRVTAPVIGVMATSARNPTNEPLVYFMIHALAPPDDESSMPT